MAHLRLIDAEHEPTDKVGRFTRLDFAARDPDDNNALKRCAIASGLRSTGDGAKDAWLVSFMDYDLSTSV